MRMFGVRGGVAVDPEPSGVHDVEAVETSHLPVVAPQSQMKLAGYRVKL